jgi:hypothetical protein
MAGRSSGLRRRLRLPRPVLFRPPLRAGRAALRQGPGTQARLRPLADGTTEVIRWSRARRFAPGQEAAEATAEYRPCWLRRLPSAARGLAKVGRARLAAARLRPNPSLERRPTEAGHLGPATAKACILSVAGPRRPASSVASARTLGSRRKGRAAHQQEVRLRRELEQPRRGRAASGRGARVNRSVWPRMRVMATPVLLYHLARWGRRSRERACAPRHRSSKQVRRWAPRYLRHFLRGAGANSRAAAGPPKARPLSSLVSSAPDRLGAEYKDNEVRVSR